MGLGQRLLSNQHHHLFHLLNQWTVDKEKKYGNNVEEENWCEG